jgi:hypothetical protein
MYSDKKDPLKVEGIHNNQAYHRFRDRGGQ